MKIKNMSKKQLRKEIDTCNEIIFVLADENGRLRETAQAYLFALTGRATEGCDCDDDECSTWEDHHITAVSAMSDIATDLMAMATAVGVLSDAHSALHD